MANKEFFHTGICVLKSIKVSPVPVITSLWLVCRSNWNGKCLQHSKAMKKWEVATVPYFLVVSHVRTHSVAPPCSDYNTNELQGASAKPLPFSQRSHLGGFCSFMEQWSTQGCSFQPHHFSCKPEHLVGVQALKGMQTFMTGMYFQPAVGGSMDCKGGHNCFSHLLRTL